PFSPRISTPPMAGLIALSTRACFMVSWPTMAVNGKTLREGCINAIVASGGGSAAQRLLDALDDRALREVVQTEILATRSLRQVQARVEPVAAEERGAVDPADARQYGSHGVIARRVDDQHVHVLDAQLLRHVLRLHQRLLAEQR